MMWAARYTARIGCALLFSSGAAHSAPITCLAKDAVYEAVHAAKGAAPDQLRFQYDPPGQFGLPNLAIKSFEKGWELIFYAGLTNSSGVTSIGGEVPFDKLPAYLQHQHRSTHEHFVANPDEYTKLHPGRTYNETSPGGLKLSSIIMTVYRDFTVDPVPRPNQQAPVLVLLPDFQWKRHSSTFEAISAGIGVGAFKLRRCERKR